MASPAFPDTVIKLSFDPLVYKLVAIKKAAYKFSDRCSTDIAMSDTEKQIEVNMVFRKALTQEENTLFREQFMNEVLDQDLREIIFQETEAVRNLILAQAFSKTSLLEG